MFSNRYFRSHNEQAQAMALAKMKNLVVTF